MTKLIDVFHPLKSPISPLKYKVVRHCIRYYGLSGAQRLARAVTGHAGQAAEAEEPQRFQVPGCETYFGYYDISPMHVDGRRLLAHAVTGKIRAPNGHGTAAVGFFDVADGGFVDVDRTTSWCSQMGARLRWFPNANGQQIAFNRWTGKGHETVIRDLTHSQAIHQTPKALYDISRDGRYGLSLNFARLGWLRPGYGYTDGGDAQVQDRCPASDGIWLVDIGERKAELVVSLADLMKIEPTSDMADSFHYINHIAFNPSGERFLFFHLWTSPPPDTHRWSVRAFTAKRDGSDIFLLNSEGKSSHYAWRSDSEIVIFVQIDRHHGRYLRYKDRNGLIGPLWPHLPLVDGHQSFSPNGEWLLTDTYPDRFSEQNLLLFDERGEAVTLGRFRPEIRYFGDLRCDLHPRWDAGGRNVIFDSAHQGGRALYLLNVERFVSSQK